MAWVADLKVVPGYARFKNTRAVGWFDPSKKFPKGHAGREFVEKLTVLVDALAPDRPTRWRCPRCREESTDDEVLVLRSAGQTFVASPHVRHLVLKHDYLPPEGFVRAVMRKRPAPEESPPVILESLGPVRQRPGMYIGDHDSLGLATMLFEAVGNSLDEALAGRATRVAVQVADDDTVTVEDDGAGLPLEATICGLPAIPAIFLNLHTSPTLDGHPQHIHVRPGLAGVGIAVVQALSARFDVETVRGGLLHRVGFTNGELSSPVTCLGPTTRRGTRLTWSPDRSVFRRAKHNLLALEEVLAPVGAFLPNVELLWQGCSLRRPRGLVEWVEQLAPAALAETSWTTEGEAFDVRVQVALAWEPARRERLLRAFVNCAETTEAGSHVVGLLDAVKETAPTKRLAAKALAGLVGVVHVWMLHPRFRGPVRAALDVETARFAVRDVVSAALRKTPWWDRLATEVDGAK